MKVLYGVQGTGNGHITRARIMAKALSAAGAKVDWVFTGRERSGFFDMESFGEFQTYRGLTFATQSGRVLYGKTLLNANLQQLYKNIRQVNVAGYDIIINDFEPVTAWAAKRAGKKVIGISHQNAFLHRIPKQNDSMAARWFMRNFAPVSTPIGLHWHHFNQPILPPLIEQSHFINQATPGHYLVYLPFAGLDDILPQLQVFSHCQFYVYQAVPQAYSLGHIHVRPFSRDGFQQDLHNCEGVICSAGFELPSEAIHLGKKLLVQPVAGQMEQQSNALALHQLGYGAVAKQLDETCIGQWLHSKAPSQARAYPDVAQALVNWLGNTGGETIAPLLQQLWGELPSVEQAKGQ